MSEFIHNFGVNWKLLLAQVVNFGLLLLILRFTVYKPLLIMLSDRRKKIEKGFEDAKEAEERLKEAEGVKRIKIKEAEEESISLLKSAEEKAKSEETALLELARKKESDIVNKAKERGEQVVEEEKEKFYAEAAGIIREAIVRLVDTKREIVDDHLIKETMRKIKEA